MDDQALLDLMIGRIPNISPGERVLLCKHCNQDPVLSLLSKKNVEAMLGRPLKVQSWDLDALRAQAERDAALAQTRGICYVSYMSPQYPPLLREIWDPPVLLFYRGRLPNPEIPLAAIVGTRHPSPAGQIEAYTIAKALAKAGIPVVSGLALGIDAMAHRGNSDGGAPTVAVLGSGLDEIYPATNRTLARRILEQGGALLSEYPPGTKPRKWHFPARNRIIAALARGTLIVEAPEFSGALITARFALEQGRDLWVASTGVNIQEQAFASLRVGTKKLADEGALIICSGEEILTEWGIVAQEPTGLAKAHREFRTLDLVSALAQSLNIVYEK
jgi:DNA processing protein